MIPERLFRVRARTILAIAAILIAVVLGLEILMIARQVITWIVISMFLALALNPFVEWLQEHGLKRRGAAAAAVYLVALVAVIGLGWLFVPTLVEEVRGFADAVPEYVDDVSKGRGPLGELVEKYELRDRVEKAIDESGGASQVLGVSGTALAVTKGVLTAVVAIVTIAFLTFFMLLEGPAWMDRFFRLLPAQSQPRWRQIGGDIYRTIGGYVTGNLLISVVAGIVSTVVLLILGVPYAVALGLLVAILDLIPLAGATLAAIIVSTVGFLDSTLAGIVLVVFFVLYQQLENHVLQPLVYSRTVQLSPLAILIAVLIGAELAGVLGALAAIPVAGSIQVLLRAWLEVREQRAAPAAPL